MIWTALLLALLSVVDWLIGAFDTMLPDPPSWVQTGFAFVGDVRAWLYSFNHVLPVDVALIAVGFVLSCWAAALVLNLIRVIISYLTLGGGAT